MLDRVVLFRMMAKQTMIVGLLAVMLTGCKPDTPSPQPATVKSSSSIQVQSSSSEEIVVVDETVLHRYTKLVTHHVATDVIGFHYCHEFYFVRVLCGIMHIGAHPIAGSDSNYRSRHRVMPITVLSFYHYFLDFPFLAPCLLRSRMRMLRNMTPGPWPQKLM